MLIRALGPTLTQFGVAGVLQNPYLELRDGNGNLVEANNDWQQSPEAATIIADGKAPSNVRESAMAPDAQSWQLHRAGQRSGGTTGTGLIEVYDESPSP